MYLSRWAPANPACSPETWLPKHPPWPSEGTKGSSGHTWALPWHQCVAQQSTFLRKQLARSQRCPGVGGMCWGKQLPVEPVTHSNSSLWENLPLCQPTQHPIKQTHNWGQQQENSVTGKIKKKKRKNTQAFNIYLRMKCFINYIQNQFAAIFLKFSVKPTDLKRFELCCTSNCEWIF